MSLLESCFWVCLTLVAYIYFGYPILTCVLARAIGRDVRVGPICPSVTVVTAARNEASCIREAVLNKLHQDYPPDLLNVIVVSDASTDETDAIVESLGDRVQLIRQEPRAGKTAALNKAIHVATGDIVVFADANSMFATDAIRCLVKNFSDPEVGYVTGKMLYVNEAGSVVGDGCSMYMRFENWLRANESQFGAVIGVDGGIDAVRRHLYRQMRDDELPDFVLPLRVAAVGYRVVYDETALLFEQTLVNSYDEYRMRVRVSLRSLWGIWDMRVLLNPLRYGLLSVQLMSHKLLRYLAFAPLAFCLLASPLLATQGGVYLIAAVAQLAFYLFAAIGWRFGCAARLVTVPMYFTLVNLAAAHATIRFLKRERQSLWTPRVG